jgi:RND family efflux transporter MFP subunit
MPIAGKNILIILTGCLLLTTGGCKGKPGAESSPQPELPVARVAVVTVDERLVTSLNEVTGTVEAARRATIAAKVTGTIEELPVDLGSAVKSGSLLVGIGAQEINARMAQAKAQLEQARRNFEREKRLLAQDASTPETVNSLEDAFRVAEAAYNEARTMLGYTRITAPFAGVISAKYVQAGDLATPGMPLLTLEDNRQLQVVASVPEALALGVKIGKRLPIRIAAAGVEQSGVVSEIAPSSDPLSRTTTIKLQIQDATALRPGQYVRVVLPGEASGTFMIPATAVSTYGQMERIFVVRDGVARLRLVRTGTLHDGQVEVLAGLAAGEQVVVEGQELLVDGQPVQLMP